MRGGGRPKVQVRKGLVGERVSCRRTSIPSIPGPSPPEKVTRREEPLLPKKKKTLKAFFSVETPF